MTYGIDIAGSEIRWVRLGTHDTSGLSGTCGRVPLAGVTGAGVTGAGVTGAGVTGAGVTGAGVTGGALPQASLKQALKGFFSAQKVHRFVFPLYGQDVRAKLFASDKVDISELEDNVAWEAKFMLSYDKRRDVLSFDPFRSLGTQTWLVAAAASREVIRRQTEIFPISPLHTETALTALANAVLRSKWGKKDVMILHLDRSRGLLVVVSHGNPIIMQEVPKVDLKGPRLDENALSLWQEELKLRRNFIPQDKRDLDHFLLSGETAAVPENITELGERIDLAAEIFDPFEGVNIERKNEVSALYTLAYACALRGE
jgi:Tfp pilus assembly PilM family ATPase